MLFLYQQKPRVLKVVQRSSPAKPKHLSGAFFSFLNAGLTLCLYTSQCSTRSCSFVISLSKVYKISAYSYSAIIPRYEPKIYTNVSEPSFDCPCAVVL